MNRSSMNMEKGKNMKQILSLVLIAGLGLSLAGCTSVAGKVVKHKAKDLSPVHDTKTEKVSKKADNVVGGDDEGGRRNRDK
jgi:hypothetical protein